MPGQADFNSSLCYKTIKLVEGLVFLQDIITHIRGIYIAQMTFFFSKIFANFCIVFFKSCQCQGVTTLKVNYYISFMKSHKQFLSQAREMVFQILLF